MRIKAWVAGAVLACSAWSSSAAVVLTPPVLDPNTGHTYVLLSQDNWTNSNAAAVALGGSLVTVDNAAENAFIFSQFSQFGGVARGLWLGLNDVAVEGTDVWASGLSSAYRNWAPFEPNRSTPGSDYVLIYPNAPVASLWDDGENEATWGYGGTAFPMHGVVEFAVAPTDPGTGPGGGPSQVPLPPALLAGLIGTGAAGIARRQWRKR